MNSSRVARTDNVLKRLANKGVLTDSGRAWFTAAMDPFHDIPIDNLEGWPDRVTSQSIVRVVKRSITINRPVGFTNPSGLWSFHVVQWPFLNPVSFVARARHNNVLDGGQVGAAVDHGGIEVQCIDTGSPSASGVYFSMGDPAQYRVSLGTEFSKGLTRVIGLGYEVHDDTAPIYKQGHSFHSRQSNYSEQPAVWNIVGSGASAGVTWATCSPMRPILADPSQAQLIPDTVDWAAENGCYCVSSFNDGNLPRYVGYDLPIIANNPVADDTDEAETPITAPHTSVVWVPDVDPAITGPLTHGQYGPAIKIENLNQSSSMFTGLNEQGTFTLTVKFYVEQFPSIAEPSSLTFAKPSAKYDPVAIEMYVHAVRKLPVAVFVGDNYDGDWWADIVKYATNALTPMAAMFGFPELSPFIAGGGRLIENTVRKNGSPQGLTMEQKRKALITAQNEEARLRKAANRELVLKQMQQKRVVQNVKVAPKKKPLPKK